MRVICSWCEHEGGPALVREKAPLTDERETHGICSDHLQQMGRGETRWFPAMKRAYCPLRASPHSPQICLFPCLVMNAAPWASLQRQNCQSVQECHAIFRSATGFPHQARLTL